MNNYSWTEKFTLLASKVEPEFDNAMLSASVFKSFNLYVYELAFTSCFKVDVKFQETLEGKLVGILLNLNSPCCNEEYGSFSTFPWTGENRNHLCPKCFSSINFKDDTELTLRLDEKFFRYPLRETHPPALVTFAKWLDLMAYSDPVSASLEAWDFIEYLSSMASTGAYRKLAEQESDKVYSLADLASTYGRET